MTKITRRGETVDVAIQLALQELGATHDEVEITIIDPGKKGFFGIGARDAEVQVTFIQKAPEVEQQPIETKKEEFEVEEFTPQGDVEEQVELASQSEPDNDEHALQETVSYIEKIAEAMGIDDVQVNIEQNGKYVTFHLESSKAAFLIGKRGQTLNALQQLSQLITNKYTKQFKVVRLDVGDFRNRREVALEQLADRMADRAVRYGRKVQLEPMPSYERKIIHNALSNRLDIETYSEGTEPHRYLVIEPIV